MSQYLYNGAIPGQITVDQAAIKQLSIYPLTMQMFPEYNVVDIISSRLGKPRSEKTFNRLYSIGKKGNDYPAVQIATRTAVGTELQLTFTDNSWAAYRNGDGIEAENGTLGRVTYNAPGIVRLALQASASGNTTFQAADFADEELTSWAGNLTSVYQQEKLRRVISNPILTNNVIGLMLDTYTGTMDELNQFTYINDDKGNPLYLRIQPKLMLERNAKAFNKRTYMGKLVNDVQSGVYQGDGFEQQIFKGQGVYETYTSDLDENQLQFILRKLGNNGASKSRKLMCICGNDYIADLQANVFKQYLTTAGKDSVLAKMGVSLQGLNVFNYHFDGFDIDFVIDPTFSDDQQYPGRTTSVSPGSLKQSRTAFYFNVAEVDTEQQMKVPFLQTYVNGPSKGDGSGMVGMWMTEVPGAIDQNGKLVPTANTVSLESTLAVYYSQTHQLMNPSNCAFHQPV